MNNELVDRLVQAVLYEGYILYPYRSSSLKNRQRFTFGRIYPEAFSQEQRGMETCEIQSQCLIEYKGDMGTFSIQFRFLHPMLRQAARLATSYTALPEGTLPEYEIVQELRTGSKVIPTWHEATEQAEKLQGIAVEDLLHFPVTHPFSFPAAHNIEPVQDDDGMVQGIIIRRQIEVCGAITLSAERIDARTARITIRVRNLTPIETMGTSESDDILLRTFASSHIILEADCGAWVSLLEPPEEYVDAARLCSNIGVWPVLVGNSGERDTMLASPIILYDYPEIAPESKGDFFDGAEIDEMLALRIMTMTNEEKLEMSQVDARARMILERTESMSNDDMMQLHGTLRGMGPATGSDITPSTDFFDDDPFRSTRPLDGVRIGDQFVRVGDRVRIDPRPGADIMDMALRGKAAIIEAIEHDMEEKIYLAVVVEDDPGREFGMMRQPGHRFFFSPDEVIPLGMEET